MSNLSIKVSTYRRVVDSITAAREKWVQVGDHYRDAADEVVNTKDRKVVRDLLNEFYVSYTTLNEFDDALQSIITAVGNLQKHVLKYSRDNDGAVFNDINDWLSPINGRADDGDDRVIVSLKFAEISGDAGYPIDPINISLATYDEGSFYDESFYPTA